MNEDLSRAITPAMLEELEASRPWIAACALIAALAALLLVAQGALAILNGIGATTIAARVTGFGGGVAQWIAAALMVMLMSYARQHRRAIAATHGRLTEKNFIAIIDSQRRLIRFFAVAFPIAALVAVAALASGRWW